ncbi:MAG: TIR domain-containing protein [Fibromonadaceae bacterium]|jgi:hypothetical protein|nr:TIR domain-containing protein [Fibromonadaceae bacterium]
MAKKFDIFISYRRKGGFDSAKLLYDRLRLDGYSVSFDMDTLERGDFDSELEGRVKKCRDFVVVLNPGIFDRFYESECKDDWVRREIACAIAEKKNIVPVILDDFQWSETPLPPDIKDLARKNGIEFNPKYFEAMYETLKQKFLISKPSWTTRHKIKIISIFGMALLAAGAYLYFETNKVNQQKILEIQLEKEKEKQKTDSILRYQDSIISHRDSISSVQIPTPSPIPDPVPAPTPQVSSSPVKEQVEKTERKIEKKNEGKTLHWAGPKDAVGMVMYEKLAPAGILRTPCSGNGVAISTNRPACKQINNQVQCSYLPTLTLTDCKGKLLGALKITTEFVGLQESEVAAKKELADDLRNANFGSIISNIGEYSK